MGGTDRFPPRFAPDSEPVIKERGARALHAIIETGGKQYKVENGDVLYIEKLNAQPEETVTFREVIAYHDGETLKAGAPTLDMTVEGKVLKNGKAKKITVFTYKPKKNEKRKLGHRQPYTKVEITAIGDVKAPIKQDKSEEDEAEAAE